MEQRVLLSILISDGACCLNPSHVECRQEDIMEQTAKDKHSQRSLKMLWKSHKY
jgi:hypothetical protein